MKSPVQKLTTEKASTTEMPTSAAELLSELLGGAQVVFVETGETIAGPADGQKCPRCWRYFPSLEDAGVCERCAKALTYTNL